MASRGGPEAGWRRRRLWAAGFSGAMPWLPPATTVTSSLIVVALGEEFRRRWYPGPVFLHHTCTSDATREPASKKRPKFAFPRAWLTGPNLHLLVSFFGYMRVTKIQSHSKVRWAHRESVDETCPISNPRQTAAWRVR